MKKLLLPAVVLFAVALFQVIGGERSQTPAQFPTQSPTDSLPQADQGNPVLTRAIETRADGVQVEARGTVVRILGDDNDGSRHQRFIVRVDAGNTVLIAHNIDLAPRVSPLNEGDTITFNGEYAWNSQGGVVHWTHHDPDNRHSAGWIRHNGQLFQ